MAELQFFHCQILQEIYYKAIINYSAHLKRVATCMQYHMFLK